MSRVRRYTLSVVVLVVCAACASPIIIQTAPLPQPTVQTYPTPIIIKVVETVVVYPTTAPTLVPTDVPTRVPTRKPTRTPTMEEFAPDGPYEGEPEVDNPLYKPYYRFTYYNDCDKSIYVAVHYMDLWGSWVTDGWYLVQPHIGFPIASTNNRYVYIAAISQDGRTEWKGKDYYNYVHGAAEKTGFIQVYYPGPDPVRDNDPWQHHLTCP